MLAVVCWLTMAGQVTLCSQPLPEADAKTLYQQDLALFAEFPRKDVSGPIIIREDDPRFPKPLTPGIPTI